VTSTILLVDLLGAAALLLWGLRLLKAGVNRAFGAQLRLFLASATRNRFSAIGAGFVATLGLQSSTAMALLVSSFVGQGLIGPAMAQAVMLGANVGTAVVTQVLSFDLHWLAPAAILLGAYAQTRPDRRTKGVGEIALGLGLMLLALRLMGEATQPMRDSEAVEALFALLDDAPVIALALSTALAAACASSLAVVLFVMALATAGTIETSLCLILVAGANLGGAIPPILAAATEGIAARRVAVTNLLVRGAGAFALLPVVGLLSAYLASVPDKGQLVVSVHLVFNLVLAVVFLPLVGPVTRLVGHLLPDKSSTDEEGPRHLDETALSDPPAALAAASREALRVGDLVGTMLENTLNGIRSDNETLCRTVFELDDQVDRLENAIKLYLAQLDQAQLNDNLRQKSSAILDYAINLEHVGDIIERSLSRLATKKIENNLRFSQEGMHEIEEMFLETIDNLQLAQGVFLSQDPTLARRLMESKLVIRGLERSSTRRHMERLKEKHPHTIQTSSLHLDLLRDLKRINSHLVSAASPILEEAGLLRESRLRKG
jgi:phosphate:Na+ symporter